MARQHVICMSIISESPRTPSLSEIYPDVENRQRMGMGRENRQMSETVYHLGMPRTTSSPVVQVAASLTPSAVERRPVLPRPGLADALPAVSRPHLSSSSVH